MIAYVKGTLEEYGEDSVVLDVNGIGYRIRIPSRVLEVLPPLGTTIKLHTYYYVREDTQSLFGFQDKEDLAMFKLLLNVSGVGPKGALGILSFLSASALKLAVIAKDSKMISKAPGIGAKTAQRILIDLKDKVTIEEAFSAQEENSVVKAGTGAAPVNSARNDAIEALTALGYGPSESYKAVNMVEITEDMDSEQILKAALKNLF